MRRAAKVDRNHSEIVHALKSAGATVQDLSAVGGGCPDILVGFKGVNYALEIKDGKRPPSEKKLNERQEAWHGGWKGHVVKVETIEAAFAAIGITTRGVDI